MPITVEGKVGSRAEMNQLFVETEVNTDIREHKVPCKLPIQIEGTPRLCKRRVAVGWRWRERPDLLHKRIRKENVLLIVGIKQRSETVRCDSI
jgi:hypothetical protein